MKKQTRDANWGGKGRQTVFPFTARREWQDLTMLWSSRGTPHKPPFKPRAVTRLSKHREVTEQKTQIPKDTHIMSLGKLILF